MMDLLIDEFQDYSNVVETLEDNMGNLDDQFGEIVSSSFDFIDALSSISEIADSIAYAFAGVDENLSRVAAGLSEVADGVIDISEAFEGGEVNMALLSQGVGSAVSGLSTAFGVEEGSDTDALLSGAVDTGFGIARIAMGDIVGGIAQTIAGLPNLVDGLFESFEEGFYKQFSKAGFDDEYSEELMEKIEKAADAGGSKEAGIKANIEEFFAETDISNEDEYTHMADLLNEAIGEYVDQGHSWEEAYDKFGDELEMLREVEEQYGYETTAAMENMLEQQAMYTTEGRIEALTNSLTGFEKILSGMETQMKISSNLGLSETSFSALAGSLVSQYNQLLAEGVSHSEAVEQVKPLFDQYEEIAGKQGFDVSSVAGWDKMEQYFSALENVSGYLDMIEGATQMVESLSYSSLMDEETMNGQMSLASDLYANLLAGGLTEEQALTEMSDYLSAFRDASEKYGIELSPEIQEMLKAAADSGIEIGEAETLDETIANGIEEGFNNAIDAINDRLLNLPSFGDGGVVPGSEGEKTLIWAHGGEVVGYTSDLGQYADNYTSPSASSIFFDSTGDAGISESMDGLVNYLENRAGIDTGLENLFGDESTLMSKWNLAGMDMESSLGKSIAENMSQLSSTPVSTVAEEERVLKLDQTVKFEVNGREFVQQIKKDVYEQIKEDSKRGIISIHEDAVKSY